MEHRSTHPVFAGASQGQLRFIDPILATLNPRNINNQVYGRVIYRYSVVLWPALTDSPSGTHPPINPFALALTSSCSALEPTATIDFLRDPLAFHWAIPSASSIFARSFLRLRWSLACPKGDYAWRNMMWQLLAADPAAM